MLWKENDFVSMYQFQNWDQLLLKIKWTDATSDSLFSKLDSVRGMKLGYVLANIHESFIFKS